MCVLTTMHWLAPGGSRQVSEYDDSGVPCCGGGSGSGGVCTKTNASCTNNNFLASRRQAPPSSQVVYHHGCHVPRWQPRRPDCGQDSENETQWNTTAASVALHEVCQYLRLPRRQLWVSLGGFAGRGGDVRECLVFLLGVGEVLVVEVGRRAMCVFLHCGHGFIAKQVSQTSSATLGP